MAFDNTTIIVNGFTFCLDHGDEFCTTCSCDHRMDNNVLVEKELGDVAELFEHEVEVRQPINAYAHGAVAALSTESAYECETHKAVDCAKCFNWVEIIKQEVEDAEEHGRWLGKRASLKDFLTADGVTVA